jgi:ATP-dependent DNA helicase HFM1/MER3
MATIRLRSLTAKVWEDSPIVLRQIEQIGEKSIKVITFPIPMSFVDIVWQVLAQNGIATLGALRETKPERIELVST